MTNPTIKIATAADETAIIAVMPLALGQIPWAGGNFPISSISHLLSGPSAVGHSPISAYDYVEGYTGTALLAQGLARRLVPNVEVDPARFHACDVERPVDQVRVVVRRQEDPHHLK